MSVNTNKKFGMLKGLSDIYICEVKDSADAYEVVGTPEQLIPAGEMTIGKTIDKAQYYYDNAMWAEAGTESPSEMSLIGAAVRAALLAWLEGKDVDSATGAILDDGDWHSKTFAILGKKDYTDETSEYFCFLKCTFGGSEEAAKTKDNTTDASGSTLPFVAYSTIYKFKDGKHRKVVRIDTADTKLKADASWTAQVVTPDNLATICEKVTATQPTQQ
jgi:phi13 family phage major tail protein